MYPGAFEVNERLAKDRQEDRMRRASLIAGLCLSLGVIASGAAASLPTTLSGKHSLAYAFHRSARHGPVRPLASRKCHPETRGAADQGAADGGRILLGARKIGPVTGQSAPGVAQGFLVRGRATGTVSSIHVFVASRSRSRKLMVALYSATGCHGGSRLAAGSLVRPRPGAWNAVRVQQASIQAGRLYWLVLLARGRHVRFREVRAHRCAGGSSGRRKMMSLPRFWKPAVLSNRCGISAYVVGAVTTTQGGTGTGTPGSPGGGTGGGSGPTVSCKETASTPRA